MNNKVSVIIAIYKVGDYLEKCIQTVIGQSYKNLEIILVDDGSPDNSPKICNFFASQDERVKVIHKQNEGCVWARRDGLSIATGKYTLMIDGDDWMDDEYIEQLVVTAEENNSDLVVDSYVESYTDREIKRNNAKFWGTYTSSELEGLKKAFIYTGKYYEFGINPAMWNKLFITERLRPYFDNIPQMLTLGDDFAVTMPYLISTKSVSIIDSKANYHYRQREDSMVKAYNSKLIINVKTLFLYLQGLDWSESDLNQLNYYYSWIIASVVKNQLHESGSWSVRKEKVNEVYSLPNVQGILKSINVRPLKYKVMFWCIKNKCVELLLILKKGKSSEDR